MKYPHITLLSILLVFSLKGCDNDVTDEPVAGEAIPGNCELAVVNLFDISGSVGSDLGGGQTVLAALKQSAISVVELVPEDNWNMGLATFPSTGGPIWGMSILNNANRESLVDAIEELTAGGSSPMDAGLTLAGLMLATDTTRPRYLVVFSDGRVCGGDCETILNTAEYLKNELGIFIITIGYNLEGDDLMTMQDVSSIQPDGSSASLNSDTPEDLVEFMSTSIGSLCDRLEVAIEVDPVMYMMGQNGSNSGSYNVSYLQGESRAVRIIPEGPFVNGGGAVSFSTPTSTISSEAPVFSGKLNTLAGPVMTGDYELRLRVVPDGGNVTLATRTVQTSVAPINLNVAFDGDVIFDQATNKLTGNLAVDVTTSIPLELQINYIVTAAGSVVEEPGFIYPASPTPNVPAGNTTISPIYFSIERDSASEGTYVVHAYVTARQLGVRQRRVSNDFLLP